MFKAILSWFRKKPKEFRLDEFHKTTYEELLFKVWDRAGNVRIEFNNKGEGRALSIPQPPGVIDISMTNLPVRVGTDMNKWQVRLSEKEQRERWILTRQWNDHKPFPEPVYDIAKLDGSMPREHFYKLLRDIEAAVVASSPQPEVTGNESDDMESSEVCNSSHGGDSDVQFEVEQGECTGEATGDQQGQGEGQGNQSQRQEGSFQE